MLVLCQNDSNYDRAVISMTLNDLACHILLKVCLADGMLDIRMLWLSELTMRD